MDEEKEVKSRDQKIIRWGKGRGNVLEEYKERLRARYEQLSEEVESLEEEWKKYGEAFWGNCRSFVWKDVRKGCIIDG